MTAIDRIKEQIEKDSILYNTTITLHDNEGQYTIPASEYVIQIIDEEAEKTGKWRMDIDKSRGIDWRRFYCSECNHWQTYGEPEFCPKCGARMEKGAGE